MLPPDLGPEGCYLVGLLAAMRSVVRRDAAARAALAWGAGVLAAWAGLVLADVACKFAEPARPAVYLAAGLIGLATWVGATAAAHRRRPTAMYLAHQAERARPDLKNALVTFLELVGSDRAADRAACEAVGRRAARALADVPPEALLVRPMLRRRGIAAGAATGLLAVSIWLAQGVLFRPWARGAEAGTVPAQGYGDLPVAARDGMAPAARSGAPPAEQGSPSAACLKDEGSLAGQEPSAMGGGPEGSAALALARDLATSAGAFDRLAAALGEAGAPGAEPSQGYGDPSLGSGRALPVAARNGAPPAEAGAVPLGVAGGPALRSLGEAGSPPSPDPAAGTPRAEPSASGTEGSGPGKRASAGGPPSGAGAGAPPIPERPQPATLPPKALDSARWAERLIGEADRRLQDGDLNDGFLKDMGMGPVEFRRFVTTWKRRFEGSGGPDATAPAAGVRTVPAGPAGRVLAASGAGAMRPIADAGPSGIGAGPAQEGDSIVVPRLRPYVAAYFEAVGRPRDESNPRPDKPGG